MSALSRDELRAWSQLVQALCGVHLDDSKGYLIESRLGDLKRETRSATFGELCAKVCADASGMLKRKVADAITTNETSFFRDSAPFELLQHKVIPDAIDARRRASPGARRVQLRVWSAACSTGQEVYSLAILLHEMLRPSDGVDVSIVGTDVSDRAVAHASRGWFAPLEVERGVSPERLRRYFVAERDGWRVRDEIRLLASFRTMNLLEPFPFATKFDVVLCRNVAIYFTEPDKVRLYGAIAGILEPHGSLLIGSTESITGVCPQFVPRRHLRAIFYQLAAAPTVRAA